MNWLILNFMLAAADPVHGTEFVQAALVNQAVVEQQHQKESVLKQRADFQKRFNDLVNAVASFAADYNHGNGEVWPAKKAEALRNAMKALEKADARIKK